MGGPPDARRDDRNRAGPVNLKFLTAMNPLLEIQFRVPFDKIEAAHMEPAMDQLLADAAVRLDATITNERPLHALDVMTEKLDYAMSVVRHLESVRTTP